MVAPNALEVRFSSVKKGGLVMKDKDSKELRDPENWDWEHAQSRPGRKKPRAVVSVAFSRDDFDRVAVCAERADMKLSEFIRSAALQCAGGTGGSSSVSVGSQGFPITWYLPSPPPLTWAIPGRVVEPQYQPA